MEIDTNKQRSSGSRLSQDRIDELRRRYRHERDIRMTALSQRVRGEVLGLAEIGVSESDPHTPLKEREPLDDDVDVLVIGGGLSGLLVGAHLRMRGVQSLRMVDHAGDFGGVWYWNRYPGAQCDVESYIYMPLLEETGYVPTEKYAHQPEIFEHCQRIGRHFDLYRDACFHTEVTGMHWDDDDNRWVVRTNRGDRMRARFVLMTNGPMDKPRAPRIPGIETFKGHAFHSSRWDYQYTGGSTSGGLDGLADKSVGIIGTGATAVQIVPHLARSARQLYVFQRTPSTIAPRNNRPTDPEWASRLTPGWQKERMDNFTALISGVVGLEDLVDDGWTKAFKRMMCNPEFVGLPPQERLARIEIADLEHGEEVRSRVDTIIKDPELAESLKAYYYYFCKRPGFHDEYLQSFNLPNVSLVDTRGREIDQVTEGAVHFDGVEYPVDVLIFATGFDINSARTRRAGFDVVGRDGVSLADKWADGMSSLHGLMTAGFPNMGFSPGVNSQFAPLTINFPTALGEFARHMAYVVAHCLDNGIEHFDVDRGAEADWVHTIKTRSARSDPNSRQRLELLQACVPGYFNNEGRPEELPEADANFGGSALEFYDMLEKWRAAGDLAGLVLEKSRSGQLT